MADATMTATQAGRANPDGKWFSISRPRLELGLLWLTFAASSIVLFEPAPFDFLAIGLVGFWLLVGLAIPKSFSLPLVLFSILALTGLVAAVFSDTVVASGRHILITIFLFTLTVGIGAFVARDPERALTAIMSGYTVAAVVTVVAGVVGYFSLVDGVYDIFTERDRARGTFKDPNVFGPFLVVPIVYGFLRHMTGQQRIGGAHTWIVAFLCFGLLLSFSRGAWGNLLLSMVTASYLLFILTGSNSFRLKVFGLTLCLAALALCGMLLALSFDSISDMMNIRGKLIQSYDTQQRFVGAGIAVDAILTNPFGIGALSFLDLHTAEPHNVYLYSFLIGGWLGGFAYLFLVLCTLYVGFRNVLVPGPLRLFAILVFSTFLSVAVEGAVVDTDHWRHFYLLMACIWGLHAHAVAQRGDATNAVAEPARSRRHKRLRLPFMQRGKRLVFSRDLKPALLSTPMPDGGASAAVADAAAVVSPVVAPAPMVPAPMGPAPTMADEIQPASGRILTQARRARYRGVATVEPQGSVPAFDGRFGRRDPESLPDRPAFGRRRDNG